MKKNILILFLLLFCFGCSKDEQDTSAVFLEVNPGTVIFTNGEEEKEIQIKANDAWTVECQSKWIHPAAQSGRNTTTLLLTIDPIEEYANREAVLYIHCGTVKQEVIVKQVINGKWHEDGEVEIFREEDAQNPIKLIFMGDGFTKADLFVGGVYDQAMQEAINAYLDVEPFKTYRNYFCPYIVYACSAERGCGTIDKNENLKIAKDTRFKSVVQEGSTLMQGDHETVKTYARKVADVDLEKAPVAVIVNDPRRAGTCWMMGTNMSISYIPMNREPELPGGFDHAVIHEGAGHGFGLLADEYTSEDQLTPDDKLLLARQQAIGRFLNVTSDEKMVNWQDFIGRPGYERVGVVEGGFLYRHGVWRSEEYCCMINNIFYFNVACRQAIVKRIKKIAGEAFWLEDFIANDVQKAPTHDQLIGTRSFAPLLYPAPTPPIILDE